jgi:hypothetical protein
MVYVMIWLDMYMGDGKWLDMYTVVISHVLVVNILCIIRTCGLCDDMVGYVHG